MSDIKIKWPGWNVFRRKKSASLERRPQLKALYKDAEELAISIVAGRNKDLYFGERNAVIRELDLARIENILSKNLSPKAYKIALRYLENTLQLGSKIDQLCWNVPHTLRQFSFQKESSLFWAEDFSLWKDECLCRNSFIKSLGTTYNLEQEAGRLLWSAIIFGGYSEPVHDFFIAVEKGLHFDHHGLYLNIGLNKNSLLPPRLRWHADPLSEILISNFVQKHQQFLHELNTHQEKDNPKRNKHIAVRDSKSSLAFIAFRDILIPKNSKEKRLPYKQIILINQHSKNIFLPPFLSHPDGASSLVTPLSENVWNRIKDRIYMKIEVAPEKKDKTTFKPNTENLYPGYLQEKKWLDQGIALFGRKKIGRLTKIRIGDIINLLIVDSKIDPGRSISIMLLTWGNMLIQKGSRRLGKPLKVQSAHDYLRSIGPKLICTLGPLQSIPQSTDEWIGVYADTLDQVPTRQVTKLSSRIYDFHRHLVHNGWADPIEEKDIRRYGAKGKSVDANLVTFNEMDMLFDCLDKAPPGRLLSMQRLIFALGFYCGMRVTEILSLRISDIRKGIQTIATITLNAYQDTKSPTSRRDIPLTAFLPPAFLDDLLTFREFRLGEARDIDPEHPDHNELLFTYAKDPKKPLAYGSAIKPIIKLLHEITGDQMLRFHHLRHSFANWTLVRLLAPHYPMIINTKVDAFNHPVFKPDQTEQLNKNIMYAGFKVRPILYQVSNLLGHATPTTTLTSYIHISNWLTAEILSFHLEPCFQASQLHNIMSQLQNSGGYCAI